MNGDQNRANIILNRDNDYEFLKLTSEQIQLLRWLDGNDYFRNGVSYILMEEIDPIIV